MPLPSPTYHGHHNAPGCRSSRFFGFIHIFVLAGLPGLKTSSRNDGELVRFLDIAIIRYFGRLQYSANFLDYFYVESI